MTSAPRMREKLLSCSLTTQSSAILIVSIIVAHLLFGLAWMFVSPDGRTAPEERSLASQVATTVRILGQVAPAQRQAVIAAAATPTMQISLEAAAPALGTSPADPREAAIEQLVQAQSGVTLSDIVAGRSGRPNEMVIAAKLGGEWLVFRETRRPHARGPFGVYSFPISALLLIGLPLVTLSLWAARRVTSPLARLAQATETLSLEGELLPVPADAAAEIRRLATSFNALVERLQKFAADRTGMLAAISHDLRTPLTRLRLRAESLDDETMRTKMLRDIRSMGVMITSTLAYIEQQRTPGPLEQLDLAALLQTLCDEFSDSGFDVAYVGPLHCPAAGRPDALERALNNLIENAIKFGESARLELDSSGPALVIDVCDSGPGVAAEEKANILKPFYRSDAARNSEQGGLGLGLAIANTIVQSHGGSLELLDRDPHGLCVRVRMPKRPDLARSRSQTAPPAPVAA